MDLILLYLQIGAGVCIAVALIVALTKSPEAIRARNLSVKTHFLSMTSIVLTWPYRLVLIGINLHKIFKGERL